MGKAAKLDANDNPIKVVAGAFKIRRLDYDEAPVPHITVVMARVDPATLEEIGPLTQFDLKGEALVEVMTPSQGDGARKYGDFRMSDIEAAVVKYGKMDLEQDATLPNHFESVIAKAASLK